MRHGGVNARITIGRNECDSVTSITRAIPERPLQGVLVWHILLCFITKPRSPAGRLRIVAVSDIVVIGAGIAGAGAAFRLASQDAKVTVVERAFPASGPTGRS